MKYDTAPRTRPAPRVRVIACCLVAIAGLAVPAREARAPATDVEGLLVVDCLLPGQIRRLGQRGVYQSARRPIKTTAADCGIRGGEYVAYDRADYRTALTVWLEPARSGDPEAQTYVGEIFEKGLGVTPDFDAARQWYQRAAESGFQRAQINLGHLYEKGLGVPADAPAALGWYRRAAGLEGEVVLDASPAPADGVAAMQARVRTLEDEASELRRSLALARQQLAERPEDAAAATSALEDARRLDAELARKRAEIGSAQATLAQLAQAIAEREAAARDLSAQLATLRASVASAEDAVGAQAQVAALERELERLSAATAERHAELAELESREQALAAQLVAGPEIVLIEPELATLRGVAVDGAAVVLASTRRLVGRVSAPAGLVSLTVNGSPVSANQSGVFTADVAEHREPLPMRVVAVDGQGKRATLEFVIPAPAAVAPESSDNARAEAVPDIAFGRYFALVIGNNNYRSLPRLSTAIADAEAIGTLLRQRYGFEVTKLIDADRYAILSALNALRENLTSEDNLLVYYAGHGELDRVNVRGHWLPVDAERTNTANWISNTSITDILNVLAAKHVLVIADSCYSGSLTRSALSLARTGMTAAERRNWLEAMARKRARVVLSSGGVEPVLDAGGGEHSVFAAALLAVLGGNDSVLDGQDLYQEVAARVALAASDLDFEQVPEYAPIRFAGHEGGDFLLVPVPL